jgi:hypothetical protein
MRIGEAEAIAAVLGSPVTPAYTGHVSVKSHRGSRGDEGVAASSTCKRRVGLNGNGNAGC